MPKNSELDMLKSKQQELFNQKQAAYQKFKDLRSQTDAAYASMQQAWNERDAARNRMNNEFQARKSAFEKRNSVWEKYGRIRDYNNSRISTLKSQSDAEHRAMQDCFERANNAYQLGDKASASIYSQEGHAHKGRRDELNALISALGSEVKQAKAQAEAAAPQVDSYAFNAAKADFQAAKTRHEAARANFIQLKAERNSAKSEFEQLQASFKEAQANFRQRLDDVKQETQRERDLTLDQAGVRYGERADAKIVKKADGTTQIYHGGLGSGDGFGHGHTSLDQYGQVTYDRDAFSEHGSQNYTDAKYGYLNGSPAKVYPDRRRGHEGWNNIIYSDKGEFETGSDHGHILTNEADSVIVWRDQGQTHGEEYLIDELKDDHTRI